MIGDFTGLIGDPSGRNATRPALTAEEVQANATTYQQQIFKILDPAQDAHRLQLALDERDELGRADSARGQAHGRAHAGARRFRKRYKGGQPIAIHEFLYPLVQGYDSVALKADVELGGTDQKFNLLVGRQLQEAFGQEPQVVLTMPLLEGLDGVNKMSKSLGNYIGVNEPADDMFGKLMSVSDELMWRYFDLLSFRSNAELAELRERRRRRTQSDDREVRAGEGNHRALSWRCGGRSRRGQLQESQPETRDAYGHSDPRRNDRRSNDLARAPAQAGWPAESTSAAHRLIEQGGVKVDGEKVDNPKAIDHPGPSPPVPGRQARVPAHRSGAEEKLKISRH